MEKVPYTNILQKLRALEARQNFARKLGIYNYLKYIGLILPKEKGIDVEYFLKFLRGEKKVKNH